jgi:L-aspartate oxidase
MTTLVEAGYDPAGEPIPVSPAAHYAIGGIVTDLDGRTTVPGLYAAGECACTGVHGANRLASNSLLECLVFGRRAGLAALHGPRFDNASCNLQLTQEGPGVELWHDAGLIRSAAGLTRLLDAPHPLARLVAAGALAREESRGVHFREDFPVASDALAGHFVVRPGREPELELWS